MSPAVLRLAHPGFFVLGFLARLPIAPLGTLVFVASATGSFAFAGIAGAAQGLASAAGGPLLGALADRYGHPVVGAAGALCTAAALVWLIIAVDVDRTAVVAAAALAGLTQPPTGALVRVYWSRLLRERSAPGQLAAALSYETVADETSWVVGPFLVGALGLFGPIVPLATGAALLVAATLPFALRYGPPAIPPPQQRAALAETTGSPEPMPWRDLGMLFLAMAALGAVFGAVQTGVTVYAETTGRPDAAGLIYALLGVGSAVAGMACGLLPARFSLRARYLVFAATLLLGSLPLLGVGVGFAVPLAVAILSVTIAPYMISLYALTERLAPRHRAGLAIATLCAGGPTGTAAGRGIAGVLADQHGSAGAFAVAPAAAGLALLLALAGAAGQLRTLRPGLVTWPASARRQL
ncbi:MFS transporter [Pseudonocardia sp. GCM10023141]|uniref:MFS transporter n=1 Tax=Pseudonocardia sp. GCM10023141 TaxID=3252653 RepID=UPI003617FF00